MFAAPLILCAGLGLVSQVEPPKPPDAPTAGARAVDDFKPDLAWKALGPSLWFDPAKRRLVMRARVALREGPLEHLLCLRGTKEHESILATSAVPRQIHAGLLLTGAEVGHPVRFLPKFEPPAGTPIAITVEWTEAGQTRTADARDWVLDERSKKPLSTDWVFAGSEIVEDPGTKTPYYLADDGDLITVANFGSAILDLPFASSDKDADRVFVARTAVLPPKGTPVTLYFQPRMAAAGTPRTPSP